MYSRLLVLATRLSTLMSQRQGLSWNVIPSNFSQLLRSIPGTSGGSGLVVLLWISISHVFERFKVILLLSPQCFMLLTSFVVVSILCLLTGMPIVTSVNFSIRFLYNVAVVTSAFWSSVFAVHTTKPSRCFQLYPIWGEFSKSSVFGDRKRRFSVDGKPFRRKKGSLFKFIRLSVDVAWT